MRQKTGRIEGLDFARFLAFFGMVLVNFSIVMKGKVQAESPFVDGLYHLLVDAMQGRAAALFVILAGLGFGLAFAKAERMDGIGAFQWQMSRRALFLFVLGLANTLIFDADILHYYALYFLVGLVCIQASQRGLWFAILGILLLFQVMLAVFSYDAGWNWETLSYSGFWTFDGFLRNLFFNGWHPVIPWSGFFLLGLWLSRLPLGEAGTARKLLIIGGVVWALSVVFASFVRPGDPELALYVSLEPIPPMPLYMVSAAASALCVIGLSLLIGRHAADMRWFRLLSRPGRHALTLYLAHIYLGMGVLEELGAFGTSSKGDILLAASIFALAAILYAHVWQLRFTRGPLEALMRRVAG